MAAGGCPVSGLRIGSLCTGYGGLDMAVQRVLGGELAWVADIDLGASVILAHHHPEVPNLGDIAAVRWADVAQVDVLTAGFPCQDVSSAGKRAGLAEGTRSGLWRQVARAIRELTPTLVVIENVQGLLSARADGDVQPCPWCLGDTGTERAVRALGTVLADLARLGFDAEWVSVRASDIGAAHQRTRVFLTAWPAHPKGPRLAWPGVGGRPAGRGVAAAHPDGLGGHRHRTRRPGRDEPAADHLAAADAEGVGEREPADKAHPLAGSGEARPVPGGGDGIAWGRYARAVRRWEHVLGRPAPEPTDALGRLSPVFVEWLMGLPAGHVTAVPGLTRTAQLKALGNGVLPAQAAAALRLLLARAVGSAEGTGRAAA